MARLWDKLTGKAPFKEDPETPDTKDAKSSDTDATAKKTEKADTKSEPKDSKIKESLDKHVFNNKDLKTVLMWLIPIVVCVILVFITKAIFVAINDPLRNEISAQTVTMNTISNEINAKNNEYFAMESNENYHQKNNTSSDLDTSEDDAIMVEFLRKYTCWGLDGSGNPSATAGREFDELREDIIDYRNTHRDSTTNTFDIDESFVQCFFPNQGIYHDRETGVDYYQIDYENLNSHFETLSSYPVALISETATQYAGIVKLSTKATDGSGRLTYREVYIVYTIDRAKPSEPRITVQRVAVIAD